MDESELAARVDEQDRELGLLKEDLARLRSELTVCHGGVLGMLARRGFDVYRTGRAEDVIGPLNNSGDSAEVFYRRMHRYSFRLFLRDVIKYQDGFAPEGLVRYSALPVVTEYTRYLLDAGILEPAGTGRYRVAGEGFRSFGPTLEWYTAEVFRREYGADAVWGVRFKGARGGGDYDVLASVEGRLVYAEVKSSPPKQIYDSEVAAFISRTCELSAGLSLFIMDTELRMKDKVVPMFEHALPDTPLAGTPVMRFKDELFNAGPSLFILNSKDGLAANIGRVLGWHLRRRTDAG